MSQALRAQVLRPKGGDGVRGTRGCSPGRAGAGSPPAEARPGGSDAAGGLVVPAGPRTAQGLPGPSGACAAGGEGRRAGSRAGGRAGGQGGWCELFGHRSQSKAGA